MSATYALLTHFPGPLMPNTHKDKVSLLISALHTSIRLQKPLKL